MDRSPLFKAREWGPNEYATHPFLPYSHAVTGNGLKPRVFSQKSRTPESVHGMVDEGEFRDFTGPIRERDVRSGAGG